jgi:hypothetical protein
MQIQSQQGAVKRDPGSIFDTAFRIAVFLIIVIDAFSLLIMGIFATNSDTPMPLIVGSGILISGASALLLVVAVRRVCRPFLCRAGKNEARATLLVATIVFIVSAPTLMFGVTQCLRNWLLVPREGEAAVEAHNSIPQF